MILKPKLITKIEPGHWASKGLVGSWIFNEGGGDLAFDSSGNGNHGTLVADTHSVPGRDGPVLDFDGSGDQISLANSSSLNFGADTDFTFIAMIKTTVLSNKYIISSGKGTGGIGWWAVWIDNNVVVAFIDDGSNIVLTAGTITVDDSVWHHVAVSYNRDGLCSIYVDGVFDNGGSIVTVGDIDNNEIYLIGNRTTHYLAGQISHVLIYNRALSASEISSLYLDPYQMFKRNL